MAVSFAPDARRASALDERMHRELAASLSEVARAVSGQLAFDAVAFSRFVDRLNQGERVLPGTFGRYYDLIRAVTDGRDQEAATLMAALSGTSAAASGLAIEALDTLADASDRALYLRLLHEEDIAGARVCSPTLGDHDAFTDQLAAGFALLDTFLPELAGEIRALVRQIVTIASRPGTTVHIDGGSHYQLWGALFLNVDFHRDAIAVAEVLAHESAHSLLFGLCIDEPLVLNHPTERYASPLRSDKRPMDGIFHATFVAARMHWTMSRLAKEPGLNTAARDHAARSAADDRRHFESGCHVVKQHGKLTSLGRDVFAAAGDYMRNVA